VWGWCQFASHGRVTEGSRVEWHLGQDCLDCRCNGLIEVVLDEPREDFSNCCIDDQSN
jgi:hypothetical protein